MVVPPNLKYLKKKDVVNFGFNALDFALDKCSYAFAEKQIKIKTWKHERTPTKYFLLIEVEEKELEE